MSKSKKVKGSKAKAALPNPLTIIAEDIAFVAGELGVSPHDLTLAQYFANGGAADEWQIRKNGGYNQIKKALLKT
jgi:hypothetical protein